MKSAKVKGPIGWLIPNLITVSIASGSATPSITQNMASFSIGKSIRLLTKPGKSFTRTGTFCNSSANLNVASKVSSLVVFALITSTSFMTGTGFMKCIPTTLSGLPLASAKIPIGILEVFDAKIVLFSHISPKFEKRLFLISTSSMIASITISQLLRASLSKLVLTLPRVSSI